MPNETYLVTHDSLSNIISARAASRVLDRALKQKGCTPETVNQQQMHDILLGPVLKELQAILPSEGVKRTISQISKHLSLAKTSEALNSEAEPKTSLNSQDASDSDLDRQDTRANTPETVRANPSLVPELKNKGLPEPTEFSLLKEPSKARKTEFSAQEAESISVQFAQLDHVNMVTVVQLSNGSVLNSRGSGFEVASLSRLASLSLKLLERNGTVRSYHVEQGGRHLFLLPLGDFMVIVVGSAELNVGAVFAQLTGIKEGV